MNPDLLRKTRRILGVLVFLLVVFLVYWASTHSEGISVAIKDDAISLSHSSGGSFDIQYKDILSVAETQYLDLGKYVSGTVTKKYRFGVWDNNEFGEYNLCIYANVARYIVVKISNRFYVFNVESEDATDSFYKAFLELLQTKPAEAAP